MNLIVTKQTVHVKRKKPSQSTSYTMFWSISEFNIFFLYWFGKSDVFGIRVETVFYVLTILGHERVCVYCTFNTINLSNFLLNVGKMLPTWEKLTRG